MPTPDRTSLPQIVSAARDLLESGGPSTVTMQAVAVRVGVRAPSLYKRVRDREALLGLVADATVADLASQLELADESLPALASVYRRFAHEHPEGFRLMFAVESAAPALGRASEPVLRLTRSLVGDDDALDAARLVAAWVTGFVDMELAGAFRFGGDLDRSFAFGLARLESALAGDRR